MNDGEFKRTDDDMPEQMATAGHAEGLYAMSGDGGCRVHEVRGWECLLPVCPEGQIERSVAVFGKCEQVIRVKFVIKDIADSCSETDHSSVVTAALQVCCGRLGYVDGVRRGDEDERRQHQD